MGARARGGSTVVSVQRRRIVRLALVASLFAFSAAILTFHSPSALSQASATPGAPANVQPAPSAAKSKSTATIPWKRVPDADKKILAPLESHWATLPGTQQRKLLGASKHYPTLTPVEQERFQERLRSWSTLTPEQRSTARNKYESLNKLSPAKQDELKERWQNEKQADKQPKGALPANSSGPTSK